MSSYHLNWAPGLFRLINARFEPASNPLHIRRPLSRRERDAPGAQGVSQQCEGVSPAARIPSNSLESPGQNALFAA